MKLTKEERHIAYIIMLAEAQDREYWDCGLCRLILDVLGLWCYGTGMRDCFPELYGKQPKKYNTFWFETNSWGWRKRIQLLKQCIEETY
jgi:hypothetical protein